jgi:hypothetical protein
MGGRLLFAFFVASIVVLAAVLAVDARAGGSFLHPGRYMATEPTAEQVAACTEDAFRLCGSEMPDREAVKICMVKKRRLLSSTCKESIR